MHGQGMASLEDLVTDGLLTIDQAETFTGLGRTKLYKLMSSGELASVKIGVCRRIPRKALVALAARSVVTRSGEK